MVAQSPHSLKTIVHPSGKVIVTAGGTIVTYQRPLFGLMLIELTGNEDRDLTRLFFELLQKELTYDQRRWPRSTTGPGIELFVDAERVTKHGLMFEAWIRFLVQHRQRLSCIHILAVNQVSQLSVEIIRHLSDSERLVRLYDTPSDFKRVLQSFAAPAGQRPRQLFRTIDRIKAYLDSIRFDQFPGKWQD